MSAGIGEITKRPATTKDIAAMMHCDGAYLGDMSPWQSRDYKQCIRGSEFECAVVEAGGLFAGHMITERYEHVVEIWRLSIDHMLLRCGIGTYLVNTLKQRLTARRVNTIIVDLNEENLRGQQFFRSLGFRARLPIVHHDDGSVYRFTYKLLGDRKC